MLPASGESVKLEYEAAWRIGAVCIRMRYGSHDFHSREFLDCSCNQPAADYGIQSVLPLGNVC